MKTASRGKPADIGAGYGIRKTDSPATAFDRIAARQLASIRRLARGVRTGKVEAIHDFRVATRRLRALLKLFRDAIGPSIALSWGNDLKWMAGLLGQVRNLDAMRDRISADRPDLPPSVRPAIPTVRRRISALRRAFLLQAVEALRSDRFRNLLDRMRIQRAAAAGTPPGSTFDSMPQWSERLIRKRIRRARRVMGAERPAGEEYDGDLLHRLRIRLKQIRYAMEFFEDFRPRKYRKAIHRLRDLQDRLGEHQDRISFECLLADCRDRMRTGGDRAVRHADRIQDWIDYSENRRRAIRRKFRKRWRKEEKLL